MTIHATTSGPLTIHQDLLSEMALLRAENERLKAQQPKPRSISYKVSEKGAVSIYGMGRFPITMYIGQADRLLADIENFKAFIEANRSKLAVKS